MYTQHFRIRFSEIDKSGRLSMDGLLRLFQDVGYLHAQDRDLGVEFTEKTRRTWYLLSWQIHKINMPLAGEEIVIDSAIYDMSGSLAKKSIIMKDRDGNVLACGDTMWAYVDIDTGLPAEMDEDLWLPEDYTDHRDSIIPVLPRRIAVPRDLRKDPDIVLLSDGDMRISSTITSYYIDTNDHANNVRLTELAMWLTGVIDENVVSLRAEFKQQVKPYTKIYPYVKRVGNETTVVFSDETNTVYSVFWFEVN